MVSLDLVHKYINRIGDVSRKFDDRALKLEAEKRVLMKQFITKGWFGGYKLPSDAEINKTFSSPNNARSILDFLLRQLDFLKEYQEWYRRRSNAFLSINFGKHLEAEAADNFEAFFKPLIRERAQWTQRLFEIVNQEATMLESGGFQNSKDFLQLCTTEFRETDAHTNKIKGFVRGVEGSVKYFIRRETAEIGQFIETEKEAIHELGDNPEKVTAYLNGRGSSLKQRLARLIQAGQLALFGMGLAYAHFSPAINNIAQAAASGSFSQVALAAVGGVFGQYTNMFASQEAADHVMNMIGNLG